MRLFHNHMTIEPVLEVFGGYNFKVIDRLRNIFFEEFAESEQYGIIETEMLKMKRSLMQIYVKGSVEAVAFYQRAFDAKLVDGHLENGIYYHAELDVDGQIIAIAERKCKKGENMQFCLNFNLDEKDKVTKAYEVLKEGSKKTSPPDSCSWSPYVFGGIDKFGINWCIYIN